MRDRARVWRAGGRRRHQLVFGGGRAVRLVSDAGHPPRALRVPRALPHAGGALRALRSVPVPLLGPRGQHCSPRPPRLISPACNGVRV